MANIEKRISKGGDISYRVKVRLKGFPVQSATFKRKTDAGIWAQQTEAAIREGRHFRTTKAKKHTLAELINKYTKEVLELRESSTANQQHYLKYWKECIGSYVLADVTPALISEHRNSLIGRINDYGKSISPSTANRYTTALGHVFTVAVQEWEWIEQNPVRRITKLKEPRGRVRFLDDDERYRLLEACKESENPLLYLIVILALSTGARKNEILQLRWDDIDFKRGLITVHNTKNGERRSLPLKGLAYELMRKHAQVRQIRNALVFASTKTGKPIDIRSAWETALKRAEIEDFRFHDLRHSAASYLAMNGASLVEIAEILGHKTLQMVKRYAHLSEKHTSAVVENMNKRIFG